MTRIKIAPAVAGSAARIIVLAIAGAADNTLHAPRPGQIVPPTQLELEQQQQSDR
jgi:hypothetical protein